MTWSVNLTTIVIGLFEISVYCDNGYDKCYFVECDAFSLVLCLLIASSLGLSFDQIIGRPISEDNIKNLVLRIIMIKAVEEYFLGS